MLLEHCFRPLELILASPTDLDVLEWSILHNSDLTHHDGKGLF